MLQKRLDYGFNGCQAPFIPRAARSARRRGPIQKKAEDNKLCAFDVLATVAGNLLEGESCRNTSTAGDRSGNLSLKVEHCDQGTARVASLSLELGLQCQDQDCNLKETSGTQHDASPPPASVVTSPGCLEDCSFVKMDLNDGKSEFDSHPVKQEDPKFYDGKPPRLFSSDSSIKRSLSKDHNPCCSLSPCRDNNVNLVNRDDDENSSECTEPSTMKTTRLPGHIGDRRIRKLLASKYRKVASKVKDELRCVELRCVHHSRKTGYKRQRSQRIYPFTKRKFFHYGSLSNSPDKAVEKTVTGFGAVRHGVNGSSPCVAGKSKTFSSRESHVKVRIKSFRVPELFVEMPETATIGSLKRTVMEAVTALLGGGLRVGLLLQGKKIRDDSRTLLQSGICHDDKVESLGFTLEPNPSHVHIPLGSEDSSLLPSTDVPQPIPMCRTTSAIHQGASPIPSDHIVTNLLESDHDSAPSPAEIMAEKGAVDSLALVALPDGTPQALAVVSAHQKPKCSEMARRIRRPFSVAEVEALVQAVEKLGTGRWRDVKLRAFDNVKHRTYVDLKDKWKTLVHTAKISPQQRRGEPVPQELLDRVLSAHGFWSQHQAKQHLKQQQSDACCLL